jgi:hypothetical protein
VNINVHAVILIRPKGVLFLTHWALTYFKTHVFKISKPHAIESASFAFIKIKSRQSIINNQNLPSLPPPNVSPFYMAFLHADLNCSLSGGIGGFNMLIVSNTRQFFHGFANFLRTFITDLANISETAAPPHSTLMINPVLEFTDSSSLMGVKLPPWVVI